MENLVKSKYIINKFNVTLLISYTFFRTVSSFFMAFLDVSHFSFTIAKYMYMNPGIVRDLRIVNC